VALALVGAAAAQGWIGALLAANEGALCRMIIAVFLVGLVWSAQRASERQPCSSSHPGRHGLTRWRTAAPDTKACAHSESASPIATAPYNAPDTTALGAAVTMAPHWRQRNRRTLTTNDSAGPSTAAGPST